MKSNIKRITAILLAAMLCMSFSVFAESTEDSDISPLRFSYIIDCSNYLGWASSGKLLCMGTTTVYEDYIAGLVTMDLQQYNGGWTTIQSWDHSELQYVSLSKYYYVSTNYQYRLKITHKAYDRNWNELESYVTYSDIV